jgi:hypothetical protein
VAAEIPRRARRAGGTECAAASDPEAPADVRRSCCPSLAETGGNHPIMRHGRAGRHRVGRARGTVGSGRPGSLRRPNFPLCFIYEFAADRVPVPVRVARRVRGRRGEGLQRQPHGRALRTRAGRHDYPRVPGGGPYRTMPGPGEIELINNACTTYAPDRSALPACPANGRLSSAGGPPVSAWVSTDARLRHELSGQQRRPES